jgi:N-acetylglucosamine kinase
MGEGMTICADVGGSFVDLAIVEGGRVRARDRHATPLDDWPAFVKVFADYLDGPGRGEGGLVALSLAGLCADGSGLVVSANIPCLHGRALRRELADALGRSVAVTNDADCFVLAEAAYGAARGKADVFGIVLGTGVGGGLLLGGRLLTSRAGVGGEWGHGAVVTAARDGRATPLFRCGCGQDGCLDTVGGARGLERLHRFLHGADASSRAITAAWIAGDREVDETIALYLQLVSGPLAMLLNTVPVAAVPVGGGLSSCRPLVSALDRAVRARLLAPPAEPLLVATALGGDAGLIGAGLAARQSVAAPARAAG